LNSNQQGDAPMGASMKNMKTLRFKKLCALLLALGTTSLFGLTVAEITDVTPKVDEVPVPIRTTVAEYPAQLKKENVQGIVSVVVVIDESGNVIASEISKSTNEGFNKAAESAVLAWKFKPAKVAGKPVKVKVTIPVRFKIED